MTTKQLSKGARLLVRALERSGVTTSQIAGRALLCEETIRRACKGARLSASTATRLSTAVEALTGVVIPAAVLRGEVSK
jgi:IS30 family transposase